MLDTATKTRLEGEIIVSIKELIKQLSQQENSCETILPTM